ncbi:zinc ribbon domain-containing protein [Halovenus marina]|uniref:zinc ribbon domain-containing protein n=1 Tax=Halovenus marina TaxID=3396621 RepID=UPI003F57D327
MAQCPQCGAQTSDGARYCSECGADLVETDPQQPSRTERQQRPSERDRQQGRQRQGGGQQPHQGGQQPQGGRQGAQPRQGQQPQGGAQQGGRQVQGGQQQGGRQQPQRGQQQGTRQQQPGGGGPGQAPGAPGAGGPNDQSRRNLLLAGGAAVAAAVGGWYFFVRDGGGYDASTPEAAVRTYINAIDSTNIETYNRIIHPNSPQLQEVSEGDLSFLENVEYTIDAIRVVEETGTQAMVEADITVQGPEDEQSQTLNIEL